MPSKEKTMGPTKLGLAALLLALACDGAPHRTSTQALDDEKDPVGTRVRTRNGWVQGTVDARRLVFRNVPYAQPPVGELRFAAPQPASDWPDTRDATVFGPVCAQPSPTGALVGSEDCLSLNVYAPADVTRDAKLPVIVYLHGAGNRMLSPQEGYVDHNTLPARGVIFVGVKYRLNLFGWIALPGLSASASNGLRDQIAALVWVQKNIERFGGDPERVTLLGISAGARDTIALVASPLARGKMSGAVIMSGDLALDRLSRSIERGQELIDRAGCGGSDIAEPIACLRGKSPAALLHARPIAGIPFIALGDTYPVVVDGEVLPEHPVDLLRKYGSVPLLIGTEANEYAFFTVPELTVAEYEASVANGVGAAAPRWLELYPAAAYATPRLAYMAFGRDYILECPARYLARAALAATDGERAGPVWKYLFAHSLQGNATLTALGAFHTLDTRFFMGELDVFRNIPYTFTAEEQALSDLMQGYLVRFAANGDPNGGGAPEWPSWDAREELFRRFETGGEVGSHWKQQACDLWDEAPFLYGP
jgi:para-nitrobenzyl esterase